MLPRFYLPQPLDTAHVELDGSEAHHLLHVLRLQVGAQVTLFDGAGSEATAEIETASKKRATLRIVETRVVPRETARSIVVATAVPKGDRFRWMVEKLTELGVTRLIPLETGHSVVEPGTKKLDKLRQTVVAAAKQSGRSRLMEIDGLTPWDAFVNRGFTGSAVFVADPAGQPISPFLATLREADESTILLIVGPEGGLTANETEQAREAGAKCIRLGRQILRIETAAIALAALFSIGPQH